MLLLGLCSPDLFDVMIYFPIDIYLQHLSVIYGLIPCLGMSAAAQERPTHTAPAAP